MSASRITDIGTSLAPIILDLPPQPWTSAQILQILGRAEQAGYERARNEAAREALNGTRDEDGKLICSGHDWVYTGTAYGGDDESYHGEGRVYCRKCGADGDA